MGAIADKPAPIHPDQTTNEAFGTILRHNMEILRQWEPVAHDGKDIEGVHQMRVVLRRMRSCVGIYRKAIPRQMTDAWGEEMKWAANSLGPARDLDVFVTESLEATRGKIPLEEGEQKLAVIAQAAREQAYVQVREMLESDRYKEFIAGLDKWITEFGWYQGDLPGKVREKLGRPVSSYAVRVLNKHLAVVLEDGDRMGSMTTTELHQLRIDGKKLRYATEFFSTLFNKKGMDEFTSYLKGLQGLLGTMNDVTVMGVLLDTLTAGVEDKQVIQFAGALIGWRARQYEEVRGQLFDRWNNFSNTVHPWLMKR